MKLHEDNMETTKNYNPESENLMHYDDELIEERWSPSIASQPTKTWILFITGANILLCSTVITALFSIKSSQCYEMNYLLKQTSFYSKFVPSMEGR
jgi:hypothetical protein